MEGTKYIGRVQQVSKELGGEAEEILFQSIGVFRTNDELVKLLTVEEPVAPGSKPVRSTHAGVRGRFIDDALIYRSVAE